MLLVVVLNWVPRAFGFSQALLYHFLEGVKMRVLEYRIITFISSLFIIRKGLSKGINVFPRFLCSLFVWNFSNDTSSTNQNLHFYSLDALYARPSISNIFIWLRKEGLWREIMELILFGWAISIIIFCWDVNNELTTCCTCSYPFYYK